MHLGLKTLVVEDDESLRKTIKSYLSIYVDIDFAPDLSTCGKLLEKNNYDLLVLDKSLPDGNSIERLPLIRTGHPHLAIIIMTGDKDYGVVSKALNEGADHYVFKTGELIQNLLVGFPIAIRHAKSRSMLTAASSRPNIMLPILKKDLSETNYQQYMRDAEKIYLQEALRIFKNDISALAEKIGLARSTLFRKISDLDINKYSSKTDERPPTWNDRL